MPRNFLLMPRRYLLARVRRGCEKIGEGVEDLWRPLLQTWDKNQVPWWIFISWFLIVLKASGVRKADFSDLFFLLLVQIEISCILPSVPHQSQLNWRKPGARSTTPGSQSALRATPLRWQPELVFDLNIVEDDYLNVIFEWRGTVVLCFISNKGLMSNVSFLCSWVFDDRKEDKRCDVEFLWETVLSFAHQLVLLWVLPSQSWSPSIYGTLSAARHSGIVLLVAPIQSV